MSMKRVISLIVALSMLFTVGGVSAFAAGQTGYSDVDGTGYETAVSILRTLGIMSGYADGQFHPYTTITRAEMAELAVRLRGITDYGTEVSAEEVQYKDVIGHPKAAAVAYARSLGIIDGGDDGYFYPDDPATYEQAVKMIIGAIGYDYYATARAPYPQGYLSVANELKLTAGIGLTVGSYITRGDVAKIACKALTTDMMVERYFSDDSRVTYEVVEGKNILNTYFNVEKLRGVVEENEVSGLYGESTLDAGEVRIGDEIFYYGLTNVGDYLGYYVSFYAIESELRDQRIIVSYEVESSRNDYIKINAEDIENVSYSAGRYVYEYWRSSTARNTSSVKLSSTPTVIFNGVALTDFSLSDLSPKYGQVTLTDTDNDRVYDLADIISYDVMTVLSASDASGTVSAYPTFTTGTRSVQLKVKEEDEDDNIIIRIIDGSGNTVPLSSIRKNTVLFVAVSKDTKSSVRTAIVSNNAITGTVSSINADGDLRIDGQYYGVISYMEGTFSVGDSGTFFLTHDGRIAGFDGEQKVSRNIGMYVSCNDGKLSEGGDVIKIYKADGTFGIYNLAGTVKLNGTNISGTKLFAMISDENSPLFGKRQPDSSNAGKIIAEPSKAGILFKTNSNGDISEIVMNDKSGVDATVAGYDYLPTGTYASNELRGVVQRGRASGWSYGGGGGDLHVDYDSKAPKGDATDPTRTTQKIEGSSKDCSDTAWNSVYIYDTLYYSKNYHCFHRQGNAVYVTDSMVMLQSGDDYQFSDDAQAYSVRTVAQLSENESLPYYEMYFYYFGNSEYPEFAVCYDEFNPAPSSSNTSSWASAIRDDWNLMTGNRKTIAIVDRIVEEYTEEDDVRYKLYYWDAGSAKSAYFNEYYDRNRFRDSAGTVLWRRGDMIRFTYVSGTSEIGNIERVITGSWNDPTTKEELNGGYNSSHKYKYPIKREMFTMNNNDSWRQLYYIGRITAIESSKYFSTLDLNYGESKLEDEIITGACYRLEYNNRGYISGVETVGTDALTENQLVLVHMNGQFNNMNMKILETYILYEYEDIAESRTLREAYKSVYPEEWDYDATTDSVAYDDTVDYTEPDEVDETIDEEVGEKIDDEIVDLDLVKDEVQAL